MDDLPLPQEPDGIAHVWVIAEPEDVVIGQPRLLFGGQVFGQVGDHVAGGLHAPRRPGEAGGGGGVDAHGVVYKVGGEAAVQDLVLGQVPGELVDDGGDHL